MKRYIVFIISILYITVGCTYNKHTNEQKRNLCDTLFSKKVRFPKDLKILNGKQFDSIDSFIVNSSKKNNIISIVDGNCAKCVVFHLNKIDSIFHSIVSNTNTQVVFVLNVSKEDSAFFMQNFQPLINVSGDILWDSNFYFEQFNDLLTPDINLRTFMTNKEGQIVQYGNPILHSDVIAGYREELKVAK